MIFVRASGRCGVVEQNGTADYAFTPDEMRMLWKPFEPKAVSLRVRNRLIRLGLLERVNGDYFVTSKGKVWRELP